MRWQQLTAILAMGWLASISFAPFPSAAQEYGQAYEPYPPEARVWLDRGADPVLNRGERVRIYYRVSESSFVAIFHIDTNGNVRMVFPSSPQENHYARGGRDYRVLFPGSSYWYVDDDPGMGYFFIVASPEPFDFRDFGYSHFAGGWDLSRVGRQVYGDPYLAMDDYVAALIPDWEYVAYGLDFTSYDVDRRHDYPRFLCYDCHGFKPYYAWNPYAYSCSSFRVVIYDDPYYYPVTRYRGSRVVYVQPRRGVAHFGFKERARGEAGTPQVVVRTPAGGGRPGVDSDGNRRAVPRSGTPDVRSPGRGDGSRSGIPGTARPGVEGTERRRSGTSGSGTPGASRPGSVVRPGGNPSATTRTDPAGVRGSGTGGRPVLERRPTGSGSSTARPTTRPGGGSKVTRPTSRIRPPGGGGTPARENPRVRSGTSSSRGTPNRSNATVRRGGTTSRGTVTRPNPTVRRGGTTSRGTVTRTRPPTVRSRGSTGSGKPKVGSSGSTNRRVPTVRPGGSGKKPPPRTVKPPRKTKPKRPPGGGGGGGG